MIKVINSILPIGFFNIPKRLHGDLGRLIQMVGWRILSMGLGAGGSIWAARCLGPEKLGISGMIIATITQIVLLVDLNQNAHLVRQFKTNTDLATQQKLTATIFSFRMILCMGIICIAGLVISLIHVPPAWHMGLMAAFPLFFVTCNQGIWVLQAKENQPAQYRAGAVQSVISAGAYFLFFRPGIAPGWDVVVQVVAVGTGWLLVWRWAALDGFKSLWSRTFWADIRPFLKEGRWLMMTGVVVYVYTQFESPLLGYLSSIQEMGCYRSATSLVNSAQAFLAMVPILLYPRFIEWFKDGPQALWNRQVQLARVALAVALPSAALAFFLSPYVFHLLFGTPFAKAATPFALLFTSKLVVLINGIFGWGLWAMKKDKQMLVVMLLAALFSISSNLLLIPHFGMIAAAAINLTSEILILAGCFYLTRRTLNQHHS